ncbi:MSCRAMM family protein, partial [Ruania rhizosphaerae]|uniref:MSCRAMM family protein n=1 Tax=Ruania rhizosphaerae TaxID=1840413 RepID=UPI0013582FA9
TSGDLTQDGDRDPSLDFGFVPGAALQWNKVDASGIPNMLAGSEWELTAVDGSGTAVGEPLAIADCGESPCTGGDVDPTPGSLLVEGLTPGEYQLVETRAPVGYVLDSTPILVTVAASTQATVLADVVNEQQEVPTIPLTGGWGSDHYSLAGIMLLLMAAGLTFWHRRNNRFAH